MTEVASMRLTMLKAVQDKSVALVRNSWLVLDKPATSNQRQALTFLYGYGYIKVDEYTRTDVTVTRSGERYQAIVR
jgi:hypothetical protein